MHFDSSTAQRYFWGKSTYKRIIYSSLHIKQEYEEYFNIKNDRLQLSSSCSFLIKKMIHEHHQKDSEDLFCCLAVIHEKQDQNWNDSLISTLPERKHNTRKVIWCHRTLEWPNLLFLKSTDIKRGDRMEAWTDGKGYRPTQNDKLYMKIREWKWGWGCMNHVAQGHILYILTLLDLWFIYIYNFLFTKVWFAI